MANPSMHAARKQQEVTWCSYKGRKLSTLEWDTQKANNQNHVPRRTSNPSSTSQHSMRRLNTRRLGEGELGVLASTDPPEHIQELDWYTERPRTALDRAGENVASLPFEGRGPALQMKEPESRKGMNATAPWLGTSGFPASLPVRDSSASQLPAASPHFACLLACLPPWGWREKLSRP